jgi:hypothetical protein
LRETRFRQTTPCPVPQSSFHRQNHFDTPDVAQSKSPLSKDTSTATIGKTVDDALVAIGRGWQIANVEV